MNAKLDSSTPDRVWDEIEAHLLSVKRTATHEIRNYPQPIAGCDAQIPALWERRDGAATELDRLARSRSAPEGRSYEAVLAFIDASNIIGDAQKRSFRDRANMEIVTAAQ